MLSAVSFSACTPIGINYSHNTETEIDQTFQSFADGFNMYLSPLTREVRDIKANRGEILILSDKLSLSDCFKQSETTAAPIEVSTTIRTKDGRYWFSNDIEVLMVDTRDSESNIFTFKFDSQTHTVQVKSNNGNYLTYDEVRNSFVFQSENLLNIMGVSPQMFNYILNDDMVMLFTSFDTFTNQFSVSYNTTTNTLTANIGITNTGALNKNSIFIIQEYPEILTIDYKDGQSNWVKYNSNDSNLSIESSINDIDSNYLLTTPFKRISDEYLDVNITGLKNQLTPDYNQNLNTDKGVNQRDYYGIYSGTNQEDGHNSIFLSYEGNTQGIEFKKGKYTHFHYPITSQTIKINDTTLIFNGAIASDSPLKSDKVFKKCANYKKYTNWGESLPISQQNGMWVCTWLSGNDEGDTPPVWVDRYLNPTITNSVSSVDSIVDILLASNRGSYISTDQSKLIEIDGASLVSKWFKNYQQSYVDIESNMTFDPGVLYVYHHIGELDNGTIFNKLNGDIKQYYIQNNKILSDTIVGNNQVLYVSSWGGDTCKDSSPYGNDISTINTPQIQDYDELNHNTFFTCSSAYGITKNVVDLSKSDGFDISVNVYADDWSNLYGDQIVGNYFNGGVGLFVNNPALTPTFTIYETTSGYVLDANSDLRVIQNSKLSNIPATSAVEYIFRTDHEDDYFIIDSGKNVLKYDNSNILISVTSLSSDITGSITDVQIDGLKNLYIASTSGVYQFNSTEESLTRVSVGNVSSRILVDVYNSVSVLPSGVIDYCVDSNNNTFIATQSRITKNGTDVFNASNIKRIVCDLNDNIWVLYGNKLAKLTNLPVLISSTELPTSGSMNMVLCRTLLSNNTVDEYIIVVDESNGKITKIDTNNQIIQSVNLSNLSGNFVFGVGSKVRISKGDPSGYEFQRKYSRLKQRDSGVNVKMYGIHRLTQKPKLFKIYANTSTLSKGWHNFTILFDSPKSVLKLLIDGRIQAYSSSDVNNYQFAYELNNFRNEQRFIIGTSSSKNGTLNEKINQPNTYIFNGGINDLIIYNTPVSITDAVYISRNGFVNVYDNMIWNMPVGNNQYIEEIERFFQHRMPGNKSQMFNLIIRGYKPTNDEIQKMFEDNIRQVIQKIVPAYTQLKNIKWVS